MKTFVTVAIGVFVIVPVVVVTDTSDGRDADFEQPGIATGQWRDGWTNHRLTDQACYPLCRCHGRDADCSRNCGNLTFVPKLPDTTEFLNFSTNCLVSVTSDFFRNASQIVSLDLSDNRLESISPGAFHGMKRLANLLLQDNRQLTYQTLSPVFSLSGLEYLELRYCSLPPLPPDIFVRYPLRHLGLLLLDHNHLGELDMSVFTPLRSLDNLGLANNRISVLATDYFPKLWSLNLDLNGLSTFPKTCTENGSSLFPVLERLFLKGNHIKAIYMYVCLPFLNILELSENQFSYFHTDQFHDTRFPALSDLYLHSMQVNNRGIQRHAFRNKNISLIDLMFNQIAFKDVDDSSFAGCPNLQIVQLSHNHFDKVNESKFIKLFGNLTNLRRLYLGSSELDTLTAAMLSSFTSLTELFLYKNKIRRLPDGAFDHLHNLSRLTLDSNQISMVREATFGPATRTTLKLLDLSNNPFDCSCDLRWFQGWLASGPKAIQHSRFKYTCSNLPDTNVTSFYLSQQACLLSRASSVQLVYSLSLLLVLLSTAGLLYRYRWHLRLLLYEALRGGGEARRRRLQRGQFQYDVYVSYASQDLRWVRQTLLAELERWGLRLCLHDRDFLLGNNIVDDISQSVQSSKKVLVVFSRHYSRDQWCQFELHFCLRHVMEFGDQLLVTCLHDVGPRDLTAAMMAVVKMTSYIRWAEEEDAMLAFWGRVAQALWEILPPDFHP